MRLTLLFIVLACGVIIPFALWGDRFDAHFTEAGTVSWLGNFGAWAWAAGMGLLVADILLPIPGTVVMSALGYMYGGALGGLVSSAGSFLAGAVAFQACRLFGKHAAQRILGDAELARGIHLFADCGGWIVALSRWMPVVAEVVACMAGLTRMPARAFYLALAAGSLPLGFTYAAIGEVGNTQPKLAIGLSIILPAVLWMLMRRVYDELRADPDA